MKNSEINLAKLLTYIKNYIASNSYPPSYREMRDVLKIKSVNTVKYYVDKLVQRGLLSRDSSKKRAVEVVGEDYEWQKNTNLVKLPLLGKVAGGLPILAEENLVDTYTISKNFFGTNSELFLLKVVGESMIDAGIRSGDLVVSKVTNTAEDGEIVVALLETGMTVKKFYREKNGFRLQPQNPSHFPIYCQNVTILGKVIGVIKKF